MPNTANLLYRSLFFRILQTLELNIEDMEFLYCFSDTYLPLSREEGKELMAEIKKDEETFGISSLPISFIEWGKEEGWKANQEHVAMKMLQENFSTEMIMKLTGLDENRIEEIKKSI